MFYLLTFIINIWSGIIAVMTRQ